MHGKKACLLVDLDGTIALFEGVRDGLDQTKVGEDKVRESVREVLNRFFDDYQIIIVTGRSESCREDTMKWLTKEEQERFLSYIDLEKNEFKRLRNLSIVDLMLYGGLRASEVVELKIEDIKVNGNIEVTIREGKYSKYANITIVNKYSKNLRNWFKYRQKLTNEKYLDSPYLFVSERTGQLGARGIQVMLDKYAELAGMDNMTPHRLRHSYCKNLANASISIQTIADLARHSNINTTRIYVENSDKEKLEALNKM